ncbi:hypothetical protein BpHYR1_022188, partial [Brachionus plicatilis]
MFLRCISKRKKKDIKMNRTLKIFVANSNVKFILKKKKGKISMETQNCIYFIKGHSYESIELNLNKEIDQVSSESFYEDT